MVLCFLERMQLVKGLIRSIGIAIIMAQAGLYVRCSKLTYFPYKKIFTRIHGNDNIFKGETFVTEMYELSSILVNGDERSLVLGDELVLALNYIGNGSLAGLIKLESFNFLTSLLHIFTIF